MKLCNSWRFVAISVSGEMNTDVIAFVFVARPCSWLHKVQLIRH